MFHNRGVLAALLTAALLAAGCGEFKPTPPNDRPGTGSEPVPVKPGTDDQPTKPKHVPG